MSAASILDQVARHARAGASELPGIARSAVELAQPIVATPWFVAALIALASVGVTLVTVRARTRAAAPAREPLGSRDVHRLARRGLPPADIARRTGLSHDAVSTILRVSARPRDERTASVRKTRPGTA